MSLRLDPCSIRDARPDEAELLSELAVRSKSHWGYSQAFLESCRSELAVDASRLGSDDYRCKVADGRSGILGFYTVEQVSEGIYELEALFVEPEHIGTGIGRTLVQHAIRSLSECGASRLIIQGDPNASHFYVAAGARQIGYRESNSIPGRQLPLFEIQFEDSQGDSE